MKNRSDRILPGGIPRYVRCYDNGGESADRYTCVFTGRYRHNTGGSFWYLGMSEYPFHPQGIGQHGESNDQIDTVGGSWGGPSIGRKHPSLGVRVTFESLPHDVKLCILLTYCDLWNVDTPNMAPIHGNRI